MRKLLRSIARHNMEKKGITQINKRPFVFDKNGIPVRVYSKFQKYWRDYIIE